MVEDGLSGIDAGEMSATSTYPDLPADNSVGGRILKLERVRNRDVYSLGQILTAYKDLSCQNIEMKTGFDSMKEKFEAVDKRFDRLETWIRWVIGFGVGTVGLSVGAVRFLANICCSFC